MVSRVIRKVRCWDSMRQYYADVKTVDAICFRGRNGQEEALICPVYFAAIARVDWTSNNNNLLNDNPSRVTHMERTASGFDIEVLDSLSFSYQNGEEQGSIMPSVLAKEGLSRATYTNNQIIIDPHNPLNTLTVHRVGIINFRGINGQEEAPFDPGDGDEIDATVYNPDGTPPDNMDGHKYVFFPSSFTGGFKGDDIRQGMLWWIIGIGSLGNQIAVFIFNIDMGYYGQITGDWRQYISNANFDLWSDGTILHYPFYEPSHDAPSTAVPDNVAASYPPSFEILNLPGIGGPENQPRGTPTFQDYVKNYDCWCFQPWVNPGVFGYGSTVAFVLNLGRIRNKLAGTSGNAQLSPGERPTITFTISSSGTPDTTQITVWTYTFIDISLGVCVCREDAITSMLPVNFSSPGDDVNYILAAEGAYAIDTQFQFDFFGEKNTFFQGAGPWSLDIIDAGASPHDIAKTQFISTTAVEFQITALYNSFTNTGNYYTDSTIAPIINVVINPDNTVNFSGSYGSNLNNFQLFVIDA